MKVKILDVKSPYKLENYKVGDVVEIKQLTSSHFLLDNETLVYVTQIATEKEDI